MESLLILDELAASVEESSVEAGAENKSPESSPLAGDSVEERKGEASVDVQPS